MKTLPPTYIVTTISDAHSRHENTNDGITVVN